MKHHLLILLINPINRLVLLYKSHFLQLLTFFFSFSFELVRESKQNIKQFEPFSIFFSIFIPVFAFFNLKYFYLSLKLFCLISQDLWQLKESSLLIFVFVWSSFSLSLHSMQFRLERDTYINITHLNIMFFISLQGLDSNSCIFSVCNHSEHFGFFQNESTEVSTCT